MSSYGLFIIISPGTCISNGQNLSISIPIKWQSADVEQDTMNLPQMLFSIRCEVNPFRTNFRRKLSMKEIYCVKSCETELSNEHVVHCQELNLNPEIIFFKILK